MQKFFYFFLLFFIIGSFNIQAQNYSLYFDSNYGGIEIPFDASLNSYSATNQIAVSMWVNPTDTVSLAYNMFVRKAIGSFNDDFCWGIHDTTDHSFFFNNQRASSGDQVWNTGPTGMIPHQWNHIELNFDANIGKAWIYVNGSKIGEQTGFLTPSTTAANVFFIFNMSAFVDEIYYSNTILHASTVTSFTPPESMTVNSNTIGYWKINEGAGTTANDESSNGNHGIITNGVWTTDVPVFSPSISVTSPAGGENWLIGSSQDITWSHFDVTDVKLEYSTDSGTSWSTIIASTPAAAGSYSWTIPNTPTQQGRVRISDVSDLTVYDISNSSFRIDSGEPIAYYPFIGNANDESGNGYNLTTYGAPVLVEDRNGNINSAYSLDGQNDYFYHDRTAGLLPENEFTVCTWINNAGIDGAEDVVFSTFDEPHVGGYQINLGRNLIEAAVLNNASQSYYLSSPYTADLMNRWVFIVLLYSDANGMKIYVDGQLAAEDNTPFQIQYGGTNNFRLGANPHGGYVPDRLFKGMIDDVRIYDRVISEDEITALFYEGAGPSVTIQTPSGGESWQIGTNQNISWSSFDVADVKIEYSTDDGTSWSTIIASTPASAGSFSWTIPNTPSANCLVKISDALDTTVTDTSNTFSILEDTGNYSLYFDGVNSDRVKASKLATVTNNFTMEMWVKPDTTDNISVEDSSSNIGLVSQIPRSCVIHPTHGNNFGGGHVGAGVYVGNNVITVLEHAHLWIRCVLVYEYTITDWTHIAIVYIDKRPHLYIDGILHHIGLQSLANYVNPSLGYDANSDYVNRAGIGCGHLTGDYDQFEGRIDEIRISDNLRYTSNFVPQTEYTVDANTITLLHFNEGTGDAIGDESSLNNHGTLYGAQWSTDVPVINAAVDLLSPNGGESWFRGTSQDIIWSSNFVGNVKLEYSIDNGANWNLIAASVNAFDSTYSWTIPDDSSSVCIVKITDITDTTIYDISDAVFTIYRPVVTVTSPNGGEYWKAGTTENITWSSNNVTNVKLEYTTNNGTNWTEIINSTPSDGSYSWTLPNDSSTQFMVRITDVADGTVSDISDSLFQIYVPSVTVTAPDGGEEYRVGTTDEISWTSFGVANVEFEYSTDGGSSWIVIEVSVAAASGTYSWNIPDVSTSNALIRISDVLDASITDNSDAVFTLHKPSAVIPYTSHWNILSVPWVLDDPDPNNVFPTKTSNVFAFSTGYYTINSLQPAQGFWIRFPSAGSETLSGQGHSDSTVAVFSGWNIIGATEYDVAVSGIISTPPGIVTSDYFTFNTGYSPVTVIETGKGYWVKCSDAGTLLLPRNTSLPKEDPTLKIEEDWITITVEDASGDYRQLYIGSADGTFELPPVPPAELLDARFDNDTYISDVKTAQLMKIQTGEYPIKIRVSGGDLRVSDAFTGKIVNRLIIDGESLTITNSNISILRLETSEIPTEYALFQNYPNPFNPSTKIKFALPKESKVEISVYNQLGEMVERITSEVFQAGYHSIQWNAARYASGVYFYRITTGTFNDTKKMMLLK